jgi:2-methylcitrate dehydratase PrpD
MDRILRVTARVHQGAIDVLGPVVEPRTVHQAKFSMGTTLGLIAAFGRAGMQEFETSYAQPNVAAFRDRVTMVLDEEVDSAYPARWIGKVDLETSDGQRIAVRVDEPKGDPGNTLSRPEIETKIIGLAAFSGACAEGELEASLPRLWAITSNNRIGHLFGSSERAKEPCGHRSSKFIS